MLLLWIILALVVIALISGISSERRLNRLRHSGQYPAKGQATDADVQRLVDRGEQILAIRCYREAHPKAGLAEAKRAVEKLQPASPV